MTKQQSASLLSIVCVLTCTSLAIASEQFIKDCQASALDSERFGRLSSDQLDRIRAEHDAIDQIWIDRGEFGIPIARLRNEQKYFFPEGLTHDEASACLLTRMRNPQIDESELFDRDSLKKIVGLPIAVRGRMIKRANETQIVQMRLDSGNVVWLKFSHWWIWDAPGLNGKMKHYHTENEIIEAIGYITAETWEGKYIGPVLAVDQVGRSGLIKFMMDSYILSKSIKLKAPRDIAKRD